MANSPGRPRKARIPLSGEKLKKALALRGKSYGMRRQSASHVSNWKAWTAAGLPKSITTIREDIAAGIPEDRLQAYARCFQVSYKVFADASIGPDDGQFVDALLTDNDPLTIGEDFFGFGQKSNFSALFRRYNSPEYLQRLFKLMRGVYECYWTSNENPDLILRCALAIKNIGKGFLRCKGAYYYYEAENHIQPFIFRWMNNLHLVSMADDYRSLFHAMFVDPFKVPAIMNTQPFSLFGLALSEDGEIGLRPMCSRIYISRIAESAKYTDTIYHEKADEVLKKPYVSTHEPDYARLKERMRNLSFY